MKQIILLFLTSIALAASTATQVDFAISGMLDSSGNPLASGMVYSYVAGTNTPTQTYSVANKTSSNGVSFQLSAIGQSTVYCDGLLKFIIYDSNSVLVTSIDNYDCREKYSPPSDGSTDLGESAYNFRNIYAKSINISTMNVSANLNFPGNLTVGNLTAGTITTTTLNASISGSGNIVRTGYIKMLSSVAAIGGFNGESTILNSQDGASSGTSSGGSFLVKAGNGVSAASNGGLVSINAGNGTATGSGGSVYISVGTGVSSGNIYLISPTVNATGRYIDKSGYLQPVGTIVATGRSTAPAGWLLCDGTSYLRADYPDLFAAIGTAFGSAVDGLHFNVPDGRGRFMRGVDGAAARDPDVLTLRTAMNVGGNVSNNVGSIQTEAFKSHNHVINAVDISGSGAIVGTTGGGGAQYPSTTSSGGSETRPINFYVNWIIKY